MRRVGDGGLDRCRRRRRARARRRAPGLVAADQPGEPGARTCGRPDRAQLGGSASITVQPRSVSRRRPPKSWPNDSTWRCWDGRTCRWTRRLLPLWHSEDDVPGSGVNFTSFQDAEVDAWLACGVVGARLRPGRAGRPVPAGAGRVQSRCPCCSCTGTRERGCQCRTLDSRRAGRLRPRRRVRLACRGLNSATVQTERKSDGRHSEPDGVGGRSGMGGAATALAAGGSPARRSGGGPPVPDGQST